MLPLLETFWNFCCVKALSAPVTFFFFAYLQCPEIFIPLRQTLFFETARGHSEPNQGNVMGVHLQ